MKTHTPNNREIARLLREISDLLEAQEANPFKVKAYRNAANWIRNEKDQVAGMVLSADGEVLRDLPHIGERISGLIEEYVRTGKSRLLQRLQGEVTPEELFEQVPGIGRELADRIVKTLDIRTLEELERATYDGSLSKVEGFGPKRIRTVRLSLAGMLSGFAHRRMKSRQSRPAGDQEQRPSVSLLLEIDAMYRQKAKDRQLRRIAPKRFNPENRAWLPILHADKGGWSFTALYSNTVRAHDLGKIKDWVVVYYEKGSLDGQATVVTETKGPLNGKRVVRGREEECLVWYEETVHGVP